MPKESNRSESRGPTEADDSPYAVGYGKPPVHTRFPPGQSGNPRGRPKSARNKANGIPAANEERLKKIILEEAYRTISVRDGDRLVKIPTIQAILRGIALNAAKGNQRSQRMIVDLVGPIERENKQQYDEFVRAAIAYKLDWENELARREHFGETGPDPLPHPDDIFVNLNTGEIEFRGPRTKEEKFWWDWARQFLAQTDDEIARLERRAAKKPDDPSIAEKLAEKRRRRNRIADLIGE